MGASSQQVALNDQTWENDDTFASQPRDFFRKGVAMKKTMLTLLAATTLLSVSYAADNPAETPPPKIKVGDVAPDFTLQDQNGNKVSLHEFKGKKNVALAFYIFAFTGG